MTHQKNMTNSDQTISAGPDVETGSRPGSPKRFKVESHGNASLSPPDFTNGGDDVQQGGETPIVKAVPLPGDEPEEEVFYDLRMSWSGKVYELVVGGNDM